MLSVLHMGMLLYRKAHVLAQLALPFTPPMKPEEYTMQRPALAVAHVLTGYWLQTGAHPLPIHSHSVLAEQEPVDE